MSPADLRTACHPIAGCHFSNGGVATRRAASALRTAGGNPTVNYVKTYETLNAALRTMVLDSNGVLYKETTPGTLSSIAPVSRHATRIRPPSSAGIPGHQRRKNRQRPPGQYDDTNFDRVSQGGRRRANVVDENVTVAIRRAERRTQPLPSRSPPANGATENGFLVTITTTARTLSAGHRDHRRVGVAGYNARFPSSRANHHAITYIAALRTRRFGGGTALATQRSRHAAHDSSRPACDTPARRGRLQRHFSDHAVPIPRTSPSRRQQAASPLRGGTAAGGRFRPASTKLRDF